MAGNVIIVDDAGKRHKFPPGFNPERAAAIVRSSGAPRTADTRPDGGYVEPRPVGPPNQHTATTEQFRDPNVAATPREYLGKMGHAAAGAAKDAFIGMVDIAARAMSPEHAFSGVTGASPDALAPLTGMLTMPGRIAGAVNTNNPDEAGREAFEAASTLLPLTRPAAGAVEAMGSGVGRAARAVASEVKNPGFIVKHPMTKALASGAVDIGLGGTNPLAWARAGGRVAKEFARRSEWPTRDAVTKPSAAPPAPKPRLAAPGAEGALADELDLRLGDLEPGEPPPSDLPNTAQSPDAMESRIQEAIAHSDAVVEQQRQTREDARLAARPVHRVHEPVETPTPGFMDVMERAPSEPPEAPRWASDRTPPDAAPVADLMSEELAARDQVSRGMSAAGQDAANPNRGGTLRPGKTAMQLMQDAVEGIRAGDLVDEVSLPGTDPNPGGASVRSVDAAQNTILGERVRKGTPEPPPVTTPPTQPPPTELERQVEARDTGPGVGTLSGDEALQAAAAKAQQRAGTPNPFRFLDANPIGGNRKGRLLPGMSHVEVEAAEAPLRRAWRKGTATPEEVDYLKKLQARLAQDENIFKDTLGKK